MKKILLVLVVGLTLAGARVDAQIPVFDGANFTENVQQLLTLGQQLTNLQNQLKTLTSVLDINTQDLAMTTGILNSIGSADSLVTGSMGSIEGMVPGSLYNGTTPIPAIGLSPSELQSLGLSGTGASNGLFGGVGSFMTGMKSLLAPVSQLTTLFDARAGQLFGTLPAGADAISNFTKNFETNPLANSSDLSQGVAYQWNTQIQADAPVDAQKIALYDAQAQALTQENSKATNLLQLQEINNRIMLEQNQISKTTLEKVVQSNVGVGLSQNANAEVQKQENVRDQTENISGATSDK